MSARRLVVNGLKGLVGLLGGRNQLRLKRVLSDALGLQCVTQETHGTPFGPIHFYSPNDLTRWRAETFFTKEPETLEWIDSFSPGDVLWDVGANVGLYTLYAARRGVRVLAFEPLSGNYYVINRNIEINGFSDLAMAYCLALADETTVGAFLLQDGQMGAACNSFNEPVGYDGNHYRPVFSQGMVGYRADDFLEHFKVPAPNHLKIDVDGIEDKIVLGAQGLLRGPQLKSISIELDAGRPDHTGQIVKQIEEAGFVLVSQKHSEIIDGPTSTIYNYLFRRR